MIDPHPRSPQSKPHPPYGLTKNVFSKEKPKPCFFVTCEIIISYIFSENFIEIYQVVSMI